MNLRTLIRLKVLSRKKKEERKDTEAASPETDPADQAEQLKQEVRP